jgi:hypothetical protein
MTTKKFYAAFHSYGTGVVNDVAYLVRFESRAARDAYVDRDKFDGSWHRESVTRDQARQIFPDAFRMTDARDLGHSIDMRDWRSDEPGVEFFAPYC